MSISATPLDSISSPERPHSGKPTTDFDASTTLAQELEQDNAPATSLEESQEIIGDEPFRDGLDDDLTWQADGSDYSFWDTHKFFNDAAKDVYVQTAMAIAEKYDIDPRGLERYLQEFKHTGEGWQKGILEDLKTSGIPQETLDDLKILESIAGIHGERKIRDYVPDDSTLTKNDVIQNVIDFRRTEQRLRERENVSATDPQTESNFQLLENYAKALNGFDETAIAAANDDISSPPPPPQNLGNEDIVSMQD
jgi:hypothetical protein